MKIIIIDNGTKHLAPLTDIVGRYGGYTVMTNHTAETINITSYDAAILSGSSRYSVMRHEHIFKQQTYLLQSATIPILGICAGFQLMAQAYGGQLRKLPQKIESVREVSIVKSDILLEGITRLKVYEGHRWEVSHMPDCFEVLGVSQDGVEIIKHQQKSLYGVQFHPEASIETTNGYLFLESFLSHIPQLSSVNPLSK